MSKGIAAITTIALSTFMFGAVQAGGPQTAANDDRVDSIIVQPSAVAAVPSAGAMAGLERAAEVELRFNRLMSGNGLVIDLPGLFSRDRAQAIVERLEGLDWVAHAEVNARVYALAMPAAVALEPNDPRYVEQWHYYEPVGGINLPAAWDITTGDPDVAVAVIDTGILDHEDLVGRWVGGYDFISSRWKSRDGSRRDDDPRDEGDWFFRGSSSWHGSHVAGTIGAASDNGIGVAGINWQSQIIPVRVLGLLGGTTADIVDGIRWAAGLSVPGVPNNQHPVDVMNMSLGGSGGCTSVWQGAVDDAVAAGSVVVVAAGNSSIDAAGATPASCDDVVTVASTTRQGDLAFYSNFGSLVEVSAPGGDTRTPGNGVLSTIDSGRKRPEGDTYAFYQGTSMAAPHVAGVVSLMYSVNPALTPDEVVMILQETARPFPDGTSCDDDPMLCGSGIVDAYEAVLAAMTL